MTEEYKDFVVKILRKLNNAIINQKKYTINLIFSDRQATFLQEFILRNGFVPANKTINKADIFLLFE